MTSDTRDMMASKWWQTQMYNDTWSHRKWNPATQWNPSTPACTCTRTHTHTVTTARRTYNDTHTHTATPGTQHYASDYVTLIIQQQGLHQQLVTKSTSTELQLDTSKTMQFHLSMTTPSPKKQNSLQKQLMSSLGCQWGWKVQVWKDVWILLDTQTRLQL